MSGQASGLVVGTCKKVVEMVPTVDDKVPPTQILSVSSNECGFRYLGRILYLCCTGNEVGLDVYDEGPRGGYIT